MSEPGAPSTQTPDPLAREAAGWFARMRGPEADASRAALDTWLAEDARHREAYNRAAEIFAMGKLLAEDEAPAPAPIEVSAPRRRLGAALALGVLAVLLAGGWLAMRAAPPGRAMRDAAPSIAWQTDEISTAGGETRRVRLADGSRVRLGSDSELEVRFDAGRRLLALRRGEARFEVAHGPRPFIVLAGGGSVTARGTVFSVALKPNAQVDVRLLEGAVEVALPRPPSETRPAAVRQLRPGERLSFAALADLSAGMEPAALPPVAPAPGANVRDYRAVQIERLVAEANRSADRPIRLADASLASERVSGRFRTDDSEVLADRLAALFGARADRTDPEEIVLRRR